MSDTLRYPASGATWPPPLDRRGSRWLAGFGVWTVFGLLSCLQTAVFLAMLARTRRVGPVDWGDVVLDRMGDWYTCALFTPVLFWAARRFPLERESWRRHAVAHLVVLVVCSIAKLALFHGYRVLLLPGEVSRGLGMSLALGTISEVMAFWAALGVVLAIEYYRRLREREAHAARLETQLAEARLSALTSQLQPHFLFNALHGVSALMHRDVESADTMLTRLADLLRRTLAAEGRHEVSLDEEIDLIRCYADVMQYRFGDRMTLTIDIPDGLRRTMVPRLILQPLVENALEHGLARRAGAGRVEVSANRDGDVVRLRVRDDGPGLDAAAAPREGIGLSNTRRRLEELYGDRGAVRLAHPEAGGFEVELVIPFRLSP